MKLDKNNLIYGAVGALAVSLILGRLPNISFQFKLIMMIIGGIAAVLASTHFIKEKEEEKEEDKKEDKKKKEEKEEKEEKKETITHKIGFIGSGNMAEAIARGIVNAGLVKPEQIMGSDPIEVRRELFKSFGMKTTEDNELVVEYADIIILATKPQVAQDMLQHLKNKNLAGEKKFRKKKRGKSLIEEKAKNQGLIIFLHLYEIWNCNKFFSFSFKLTYILFFLILTSLTKEKKPKSLIEEQKKFSSKKSHIEENLLSRNMIIVVSIMAGKTIPWIKENLGEKSKVIRIMPNTPLMVGWGSSGIVGCKGCTGNDIDLIVKIFKSVSHVEVFEDESKLDVVTGLSGSGPAYIFRLIEAMTQGGIEGGLKEEDALELAIQTIIGAGKLAKDRLKDNILPDKLRVMVTSPHGTTEAGLNYMNENGFMEAVSGAVKKATERSVELGKN
ncbi:pyrroline-5-carboxylate reductase 2 [Anaeramoeba ignava]|uniref:Pyrroline-5-carboxylate reductase 2 n=1 Tax=Anaeramoeba ignava TaxID=1746090 RepID=A0A9Q0LSS2_ANAIG|nr:pyrroline-5-carboxylate reductase 2 [Anaeramoeba ignava]